MFVYSIRSKSLAFRAGLVVIAVGVIILLAVLLPGKSSPTGAYVNINVSESTTEKVREYLSQFNLQTAPDVTQCVVTIPTVWNETYEQYNALQKKQGYDLTHYKGVMVTRLTYTVTNYPEEKSKGAGVVANAYVYDGKVIGGDVCSVALDGFMTTFAGS